MRASERRGVSEFGTYLRTGRWLLPVEVKFNPYHDPSNGQFTFAPGRVGNAHNRPSAATQSLGRGGGLKRGTASRNTSHDPKDARNYSVHKVRAGETLGDVAKLRKGVTIADLAWLNGIKSDTALKAGQSIKLPHQAFLDAGREAKNNFLKLEYFVQTHKGKLPPDVAHPPSLPEQFSYPSNWSHIEKNGYGFDIDPVLRTRRVTGVIAEKATQGRSKIVQASAGGADRLPGDHGGHYIARRFNGPTDAFNHFAQDGSFNRSDYAALENEWARETKAGKKVYVRITPTYRDLSARPSSLDVFYTVNGLRFEKSFPNKNGNKK